MSKKSKEEKQWKKDYNEWMNSNMAQMEELTAMEDFLDSFMHSGKEGEQTSAEDDEDDLQAQLDMYDPIKQMQASRKKK